MTNRTTQLTGTHTMRSTLILLVAGLLFLSACGQKGPLYLPDSQQEQQDGEEEESTD